MKEELTPQHSVRHHLLIFSLVTLLIIVISYLHYTTSTDRVSFHIVYMQSYFLPILLAALTFGAVLWQKTSCVSSRLDCSLWWAI